MSRPSKRNSKKPFDRNRSRLQVERLEDRALPSTVPTISGFVYADVNNNGIFDPGETPIGNSQIELINQSTHQVVATTTTAADGSYSFTTDSTQPGPEQHTATQTVVLGPTLTNFQQTGQLPKFDSSLGTLDKVVITESGTILSNIQAENTSPVADTLQGTVSGNFSLSAPGVSNDLLAVTGMTNSFSAAANPSGDKSFTGPSSAAWNNVSASSTTPNTITITDGQTLLSDYTGTGNVSFTETGNATSNATDTTGNITTNIVSHGQATVTVTYYYHSSGPLQSGAIYTIRQLKVPDGYVPGLNAKNGTVLPYNGTPPEEITDVSVTQQIPLAPNNNFGELKMTAVSGFVYYDANNNGTFDTGDSAIAGVTVTLTGTGGTKTLQTLADGSYSFQNLTPGTYTVTETQPSGYLLGTDNVGTLKGTTGPGTVVTGAINEQITGITLASGDVGQNYNFGQLKPASLAGSVYVDANNDGKLDAGDPPLGNINVTLTGFSDQGPVHQVTTTAANGTYSFTNLRPGTYAITETPPTGYDDGAVTVGSQSGTAGKENISAINLAAGVNGINNNFGELQGSTTIQGGPVPIPQIPIPTVSKTQLLSDTTSSYLDPQVKGQMAFVMQATRSLTGAFPDANTTMATVQQLNNGLSPTAFINQIWTSNAHYTSEVDALYQKLLNRPPTSQELGSAVGSLVAGNTLMSVEQSILVSPAYQQLHSTSQALVQALYLNVLSQTPGTVSSQNLLQAMDTQPLGTVVNSLLMSPTSLANLLDQTYQQILHRFPSASEVQRWTLQIQGGTINLDGIAQQLLASEEFYQVALSTVT